MANPIKSLNDNFLYNSLLSTALIQLLPLQERDALHLWVDKLYKLSDSTNPDVLSIRNDYMWFILLQLQKGRINHPFDKPPAIGKMLQRLKDVVSADVYEEAIRSSDQSMSWLDKTESTQSVNQQLRPEPPKSSPAKLVTIQPQNFLENQPVPQNGIVCYMSAFSNYDEI